jgi:hypothetical protein
MAVPKGAGRGEDAMFKRMFGKKGSPATTVEPVERVCPHTVLVPRWDKIEDMGQEQKATGFTCESCHQDFTPEEALGLRTELADRLNRELTGGTDQASAN